MKPGQLIAFLNAIDVGELDSLKGKLEQARTSCVELGREDLAALLREAHESLQQGDLRTYRKRIQTVIARLGHLR